MAMNQPKKIFVDPKEEISFINEKVLTSDEEKIILVIPQNSLIFGSIASLNILFRIASKKKKLIVLVTEDEYGQKIAQKSGYLVVNKVSQITPDLWNIAKTRALNLAKELKDRKDGFKDAMQLPERVDEDQAPIEVNMDENKDLTEDNDMVEEPAGEVLEEEAKIEDDIKELYKKPTIEPKIVELEGIQVFAGGDVQNFNNDGFGDKMVQVSDEENLDNLDINSKSMNTISNFAGKDFTKVVTKKKSGVFSKLKFGKQKTDDERNVSKNLGLDVDKLGKNNKKRLLIIGGIGFLVIFILAYLTAFQFSSVDLKITLKQQEVAASDLVNAKSTQTEVDTEALTIPALIIPQTEADGKLSMSKTGSANGSAQNGNKAKGFITIYNKTDREITLPRGTKVTSVATSLGYVITSDVTISKLEVDDEPGVNSAGIAEDVAIEAETFGEKYNVSESNSNVLFTIEGYGVKDLEGKRFTPFEGGTTETFVTPSTENIDNLKKQITPELESQAKQKIKSAVPKGYTLIEESIVFKEDKVTAFPANGSKSEDGTFTLTVEGSVSALAVSDEDLNEIIEFIVSEKNSSGENSEVDITDVKDLTIQNVKREENNVSFTLSSEGVVTNQVLEEDIKDEIKGKSFSRAKEILDDNDDIEKYKIGFTPFFLPNFLRVIPNNTSRITITTD